MKIELYETWDGVRSLAGDWNRVLRSSAADTIFLTWEWIDAWWRSYGGGKQPYVLAAKEGDDLVGIAPFCSHQVRRLGKTWNCLRFIGDGSHDSDYLDCFVQTGLESEVMGSVVKCLMQRSKDWDWLDLQGPHEESPTLAAMRTYGFQAGWKSSLEKIPCSTLALPAGWESFLRKLQPRFRTKVRSCVSFFEQRLASAPEELTPGGETETWLEQLFGLHARRWKAGNLPGVFHQQVKRDFYHRITQLALDRGWLAFHRLNWGERPLALQYGFRYRNRFFLLQEGYDPDFEGIRPGLALRAWLVRHWIEAGLEAYDFLAGASAYKLEWGARTHSCVRLRLAPRYPAAWVSFRQEQIRQELKDAARSWVPAPAFSLRRTWQSYRATRRHRAIVPRAGAEPPNGAIRRLGRQLYLHTPLASAMRLLANRCEISPRRRWPLPIGLELRQVPVLHILMYHRVNDDRDAFFSGSLPTAAFRAQMTYIAKHFPVVSLEEFSRKGLPSNGHKYFVAITFDDGYRDNFLYAFPVLRELGLPATLFLATGYIESGELPWHDQVRLAFKLSTQRRLSLGDLGGPEASLDSPRERIQALASALAWLRRLTEKSREAALPELLRSLRVSPPLTLPNIMLSWDEIRRMTQHKVDFGAHTITHPVLAGLSPGRLEEEIGGSKRTIEGRLQLPVRHFAYPFGRPFDIGDRAPAIVRQAGFATAATTIWGCNRPGDDPYSLKRFTPWESDLGAFAMRLDRFRMADCRRAGSQERPLQPRRSEQ